MNASAGVSNEAEAGGRPRRRKHSIVEKRRTVEATLVAGASVARVAREHGVNAKAAVSARVAGRQRAVGRARAGQGHR